MTAPVRKSAQGGFTPPVLLRSIVHRCQVSATSDVRARCTPNQDSDAADFNVGKVVASLTCSPSEDNARGRVLPSAPALSKQRAALLSTEAADVHASGCCLRFANCTIAATRKTLQAADGCEISKARRFLCSEKCKLSHWGRLPSGQAAKT